MKFIKTFILKRGRKRERWLLTWVNSIKPRDSRVRWYAYCSHDDHEIVVAKDRINEAKVPDEILISVIAHELLHARFPDLKEQDVLDYDATLSKLLIRLGFHT